LYPLLPDTGTCEPSTNYDLSAIKGLENCKAINVTCSLYATSGAGITYFKIQSTGQCEVAQVLTVRTLEVQARNL
jgi:hypothetical protein